MQHPINNILWVPASDLHANNYNPNVVFTSELDLLRHSLLKSGWIQPLLVTTEMEIIDGFHRWLLATKDAKILEAFEGKVPIAVLDVPPEQAICMTVRMNRAKGSHVALRMSDLVKRLIDQYDMDPQEVGREIGADQDEVGLLYSESVFKHRNLADAPYSQAWIPKEWSGNAPRD